MKFSVKDHFLYRDGKRVEYRPSPNVGGKIIPTLIVVHYTATNNAEGDIGWLCNPDSGVSAHLVITKTGKVVQLVPFNVEAWHAGKSEYEGRYGVNSFSVGIENEGKGDVWPKVQIAAIKDVISALYAAYDIEDTVGHEEVARPVGRKADPGPNFPWNEVFPKEEIEVEPVPFPASPVPPEPAISEKPLGLWGFIMGLIFKKAA